MEQAVIELKERVLKKCTQKTAESTDAADREHQGFVEGELKAFKFIVRELQHVLTTKGHDSLALLEAKLEAGHKAKVSSITGSMQLEIDRLTDENNKVVASMQQEMDRLDDVLKKAAMLIGMEAIINADY